MDLIKMRDFLMRLSQAHQDALNSGNTALADQFAQIGDQADQHVQEIANQQQAPPGVPGPSGQAGVPQGAPQALPSKQPPDVQREAAQEAGSSWLDKMFSAGKVALQNTPIGPAGTTPFGVTAPTEQDPRRGNAQWLAEQIAPAIRPDAKYPGAAIQNPQIQAGRAGYDAFNAGMNAIFPNGKPGHVPGTGDKPEATKAAEEPVDAEMTSPSGPFIDPQFDPETIASKYEAPPAEAKKPTDWQSLLGEDPNQGTWQDALGLLLGGKNYLSYKAQQQRDYNNKKFQIAMHDKNEGVANDYRAKSQALQEQEMGRKYAHDLSENQRHEEDRTSREENNLVNSTLRAMDIGAAEKSPTYKAAQARIQAMRDKNKPVELKKGQ